MELYEIIDWMYGWMAATKMYLDWDWLFEPEQELVKTRGSYSMAKEMIDVA